MKIAVWAQWMDVREEMHCIMDSVFIPDPERLGGGITTTETKTTFTTVVYCVRAGKPQSSKKRGGKRRRAHELKKLRRTYS
jgi:hypothetical protein